MSSPSENGRLVDGDLAAECRDHEGGVADGPVSRDRSTVPPSTVRPGVGSLPRRKQRAPRAALIAAAGALLLMPLVYAPQLHQIHSLPKVTVFRVAVIVMLAAWGVRLLAAPRRDAEARANPGGRSHQRAWAHLRAPDLLFAAFAAWLAFTALVSAHPGASLLGLSPRYEGFLGFLGYGVFYWTASRATTNQARLLLRALTASGVILAVLALLEMLGPFRPPGFAAFGARAVSTLGNPVFVGAWLALSLPASFALLALAPGLPERAAIMASLAPQAAALYFTAARGPWLGVALGLAVALVLAAVVVLRPERAGRSGRRRALTTVAASAIVLVLALAGAVAIRPDVTSEAGARLGEAVTAAQSGAGGSAETRLLQWRATAELIAERPLGGAGLEHFLADFPRVRPVRLVEIEGAAAYPDRPHNHLLYLAFSGGVPAALLYLFFLGSVLLIALKTVVRGEAAWHRRLALCCLVGALAAYEAQALFSFSIPWITGGAAALQGLVVALASDPADRPGGSRARLTPPAVANGADASTAALPVAPAARPTLRRAGAAATGVLLLLLALPFFTETLRQTWADFDFARAGAQPGEALRLTERAVRLSPRDADYVLGRGDALERAAAMPGSGSLLTVAADMYREADDRIPAHPDIGFSLARILTISGDTGRAMAEYDAILARDPYHAGALFNLAALKLQTGDPARAIAPLVTLTSFAPADAEAWYFLGAAYEAAGSIDRAGDAYRRAVEAAPGYAEPAEALRRLEP